MHERTRTLLLAGLVLGVGAFLDPALSLRFGPSLVAVLVAVLAAAARAELVAQRHLARQQAVLDALVAQVEAAAPCGLGQLGRVLVDGATGVLGAAHVVLVAGGRRWTAGQQGHGPRLRFHVGEGATLEVCYAALAPSRAEVRRTLDLARAATAPVARASLLADATRVIDLTDRRVAALRALPALVA